MFWIICAVLVIVVALAIMSPIWRARGTTRSANAEPAAAYDLRVYRDQLREVDRDLERGVIASEDAERLRTEIGRKVLEADRRVAEAAPARTSGNAIAAAVLLALTMGGAISLYWFEGAPGVPDLPMAERIAAADDNYRNRPAQTEAEAAAPAHEARQLAEDDAALMQQLRDTVARNPGDVEGLALLSTYESRIGNQLAAREAQQQLVDAKGDQASAEDWMRLAALMMGAAGGTISTEAQQALDQGLKLDPQQPQARYIMGLSHLQAGRPDRAFTIWRKLLEEGPEDAPWIVPIRMSIPDLAWLAGQPDYVPPEPAAALPGPDADAIAAADDMTGEERQQFIQGMVSQLEARLAEQGGSPEEWARLISSLAILGNTDHARNIWAEARTVFAASPEALELVRNAAEGAGLSE